MRPEHWIYTIPLRLRSLFRRQQADQDLDQELRYHVESKTDEYIAKGMTPQEARRAALIEMGGVEKRKEECRDTRRVNWIQDLLQDVRYGLRMLRKSPGFTAVAILSLALGIGANTAIFSLINAVALRSLPVPNSQQLVLLEWSAHKQPNATSFSRYGGCPADAPGSSSSSVTGCSVSYPMFEQIRSARDVFSGAFCFTRMVTWLKINNHPGEVWGMNVSGDFFSTLGPRAVTGRLLEPSDDVPGAMPVIVMSYRYWQAQLGADSTVVGKTALINGQPVRIVGITDRSFPELDAGTVVDFWMPLTSQHALFPQAQSRTDPRSLSFEVMARLKPGVTTKRAEAEVNAMFVQGTTSGPTAIFKPDDEPQATLASAAAGLASLRTMYAKPLVVLMTVVSLILLLACANVAGLMLVRSSARQKEMAVRRALGAGQWRVTRQLLTESVLLSAAGGGLGIAFAEIAAKSLVVFLSANSFIPLQIDVGIDGHVLWFTLGVSTIVGILFGLASALRGSRVDVAPTLKLSGGNTRNSGRQSSRLSRVLVVAQVAISTLVLVGAGLLGLTLFHLETTDAGFKTDNLLLFEVNMRASGITGFDNPRFDELNRELQDRLAAMPGVSSATYSMIPLLAGGSFDGEFSIPGAVSVSEATVDELGVGPDFFETMRIPLLAGRTLTRADFEPSARPTPVVVTQMFARKIFGNNDPLGRSLSEKGPQPTQFRVVGVVGDTKYESVRNDPQPAIFMPDKRSSPTFELRTQGDPKALMSMVRSAVSQVNPDFLILRMMTQSEEIDRTIYQERLVATLSILFGLLALTLACIGLYGLVAYGVVRRTHEIGVRMALGAQRHQILRLTLMQGLVLTLVGIVVGIGAAASVTRYLVSLLYGVRPTDPWTFGGIAILLGIVAACACYIPARKAMRVDPMVALRHE
jgi:predicted permease